MKLFLITPEYPPVKSGASDRVANLCLYFKWKSEVDPYVITSVVTNTPSAQVTDDGIYIFRIMENWGIGEIGRILKLLKKENPEVIQINYNDSNLLFKWAMNMLPFIAKRYKRNLKIITCFSDIEQICKDKKNFNIQKIISSSDSLIVDTDKDANFILSKFPDVRKKLKKIYSRPHIMSNPNLAVNSQEIRKRLKISDDGKLLIYFGIISKNNGLEYLFRALRQVIDNNKKIKLLIIGDAEDEKNRELSSDTNDDLKKLAQALNLDNDIFWAGYCPQKDISMSLISSDMAILPFVDGVTGKSSSFWSVLEHGTPAITTMSPSQPFPEGLKNYDNVILVPVNEVDELAGAIIKCIEEPELTKQIGERGRKLVRERYSWENMVKELENIYKGENL